MQYAFVRQSQFAAFVGPERRRLHEQKKRCWEQINSISETNESLNSCACKRLEPIHLHELSQNLRLFRLSNSFVPNSSLLLAEREARSEFFCGLREKSEYARSDPTRPNPTQPDPVTLLRSLYLWNGLTNSRAVFFARCHHSINFVFDRHRYPPVPTTARGTCRVRGCRTHPTPGNSTTAGPIAFNCGVCVFRDQLAHAFAQVRGEVHLHVRTCTPLFHISQTAGRIAFKFCVWLVIH